ncbi:MAG: hypothetical protein U0269_28305 [Polyangiales bacterium]
MRIVYAVTLSALFATACARRAAPAVHPDPSTDRSATAIEQTREGVGPDAAASRAPNATGARGLNLCAQSEPETDESEALGLTPRVIHEGGREYRRYDRADVFLRVRQRPLEAGTSSGALALELRGPSTVQRDRAIPLQLIFRNTSARSMTVIRSNDGSYEHMREPFVDVYAENVATHAVYRAAFVGGRCGMTNQLQASDLVSIAAGAQSEAPVSEWARHLRESKIPAAGRYRLWAVYRMCGFDRAHGMGTSPVARPADLFEGRAASNAIELTVQ